LETVFLCLYCSQGSIEKVSTYFWTNFWNPNLKEFFFLLFQAVKVGKLVHLLMI